MSKVISYEKSFASHEKAKYWDYVNNKLTPREVFKSSGKKYHFICDECKHSFESCLYSITKPNKPSWCPYCAKYNGELCNDDNCKDCYNKSFASHEKAKYWNYDKNNELTPREVSKGSHKKYWFNCDKCKHSFESSLYSITGLNTWCPYCANLKLCKDDCSDCYEKSFASHEKAKYWDYDENNKLTPREVFKSSNKKFWFNCDKCKHSFESSLNNITKSNNPTWCPYCAKYNGELCKDNNCKDCYNKSLASHEKAEYWDYVNNKVTPREVFKGSHQKYWFNCNKCEHSFESSLAHITKPNNPSWCPYCANQKLCKDDCSDCYNKSLASHEKAKYWDYDKNKLTTPREVLKSSRKKYHFICDKCKHTFKSSLDYITGRNHWCPYCANQQLCDHENCKDCYNKSLASHEKAKYWDYDNNELTPREVFKGSHQKYWFNCNKCEHSFESCLAHITKPNNPSWCPYCANLKLCKDNNCSDCYDKSFASCEKAKYWDYDNNELTPREVYKGSDNKCWFICDGCNHSFKSRLAHITTNNRWCPYCANRQLCDDNCNDCYNKSLASHEKAKYWDYDNNELTPRQVFKSSHKKYGFNCNKCNHSFESSLNDITNPNNPTWCPYCAKYNGELCNNDNCKDCYNKSLASHEKAKYWNYDKNNELTPREVSKGSNNKYWFNCNECNHSFKSRLAHITNLNNPTWCPVCTHKTEKKLFEALKKIYPSLERQTRYCWCKGKFEYPFDFVLEDYKLLIELDGQQHFEEVKYFSSSSLEERQERDNYKEKCANENGYSMIRIIQEDVWFDRYDWLTELVSNIKKIINDNDNGIIQNIKMCKNNEYNQYIDYEHENDEYNQDI